MIDPLAIVTLGRITSLEGGLVVDGIGYFVFIEEEIITPASAKGAFSGGQVEDQQQKKKKIKLKFILDGEVKFTKEIVVKDVSVKLQNVKFLEESRKLTLTLKKDNTTFQESIDI